MYPFLKVKDITHEKYVSFCCPLYNVLNYRRSKQVYVRGNPDYLTLACPRPYWGPGGVGAGKL
jgi:hypothetical protein